MRREFILISSSYNEILIGLRRTGAASPTGYRRVATSSRGDGRENDRRSCMSSRLGRYVGDRASQRASEPYICILITPGRWDA